MLHPFMPFVTEEIYAALVPEEESLMMSSWPVYQDAWNFVDAEMIVERTKEMIRGIRNVRAEMNVENGRKTKVFVVSTKEMLRDGITRLSDSIRPLMNALEIQTMEEKSGISEDAVSIVVPDMTVYLPMEELVDFEQEMERLKKEAEKLTKEIARAKGMLSNEKFISKAPQAKVEEEKEKLEKYTQMLAQVQERMEGFRK
jgi:valyl-tRNA synthetase